MSPCEVKDEVRDMDNDEYIMRLERYTKGLENENRSLKMQVMTLQRQLEGYKVMEFRSTYTAQ